MSEQQNDPRKSTLRTAGAGAFIGMAAAVVVAGLWHSPVGDVFKRWELTLYDSRLDSAKEPDRVTDELLILRIDDQTIRELELAETPIAWPFPRWFYGELVAALETLEPSAIVFDFVFADQKDGIRYDYERDPFVFGTAGEAQLAMATYSRGTAVQMAHAANVVHGIYSMNLNTSESLDDMRVATGRNKRLTAYFESRVPTATGGPIPIYPDIPGQKSMLRYPEANFLVGARALGLVNHQHVEDIDGNARQFQPLAMVDGRVTADLATTAILVSQAPKAAPLDWSDPESPPPPEAWPPLPPIVRDADGITIGKRHVPLDADGRAWIRWRGRWEEEPALKARTRNILDVWYDHDALILGEEPKRLRKEDYKGKILLIGFTGQGEAADFVSTPFGNQPGVYRHAAIIDTVLTQDFPRGIPGWLDWALAVILASATGAVILARAQKTTRLSTRGTGFQVGRLLVIGLVPVVGFVFAGYLVFSISDAASYIVRMVPAILGMITTIPAVVFLGIAWTQADERRARKIAVRALGPALVKQVLSGGGELKMGGTKVPLTLFFSDIAGFTTISEKLSPEELINMLNEYLTRVSEILHDGHGATIDKYIGDAVMAFWGAPLPQPDAPVRACMAALDVMKAIDQFSAELVAQGLSPLRTRIGLNTGMAVAGGVGHIRDLDDGKFTYTAMGDTVNLASRLEGANKAYGTTCMIGPETYEQAKHAILARELDLVRVKGKTIPVRVYELMGKADDDLPMKRKIKERYELGLVRFRAREFEEARNVFLALVTEHQDPPSKSMVALCEEMMKNPPPAGWDGSNELHEK